MNKVNLGEFQENMDKMFQFSRGMAPLAGIIAMQEKITNSFKPQQPILEILRIRNHILKLQEPVLEAFKMQEYMLKLQEPVLQAVRMHEYITNFQGADLVQRQMGMAPSIGGLGVGLGGPYAFGYPPGISPYNISKYLIEDFTEDVPEKEQIKVVNDVKSLILGIYEKNDLVYSVDPWKFEEIIAELLDHKGFEVKLTGRTRDGGYDIIAINNIQGFPLKFLVQCKRKGEGKPVDIDVIRSFYHVITDQNANKGLIVTSSYFSPDARKEKDKKDTILDLAEHSDVIGWVSDYIINPKTM